MNDIKQKKHLQRGAFLLVDDQGISDTPKGPLGELRLTARATPLTGSRPCSVTSKKHL